jgi:hypothetical protein
MRSEGPALKSDGGALMITIVQFAIGFEVVVSFRYRQPGIASALFPSLIALTALGFWFLRKMALAKGHSGGWGWLALLSYVGWIVLKAFPDRRPEAQPRAFEVIVKRDRGE